CPTYPLCYVDPEVPVAHRPGDHRRVADEDAIDRDEVHVRDYPVYLGHDHLEVLPSARDLVVHQLVHRQSVREEDPAAVEDDGPLEVGYVLDVVHVLAHLLLPPLAATFL